MMKRISVTALVLGIVLVGTGAAYAAIPDPDGTVHGCVNNLTGTLRIIDPATGASCTSLERPLTFQQRGPQGPQGPSGVPGPQGPSGPAGAPGPQGPQDLPE